MTQRKPVLAWKATAVFYLVLVLVITILDWLNGILDLQTWGLQIVLVSIGVGIFVFVGRKFPDLSAQRGVLLAFSIGILTIIPAVLMSLNPPPDFWEQYFLIGLGMAAGSFLGFVFIKAMDRIS